MAKINKYINKNCHLGDLIATFSWIIQNYNEYNFTIEPSKKLNWFRNVASCFKELNGKEQILINEGEFDERIHTNKLVTDFKKIYAHKYSDAITTWVGGSDNICYAFESNFKREDKTPDWITEAEDYIKSKNGINVGFPMPFYETIKKLSTCKYLISVDTGIPHLARTVKCPMILIEHNYSLNRAFPKTFCNYEKAVRIEDIKTILER